jgi:hypothetical protein
MMLDNLEEVRRLVVVDGLAGELGLELRFAYLVRISNIVTSRISYVTLIFLWLFGSRP